MKVTFNINFHTVWGQKLTYDIITPNQLKFYTH